VEHFACLEQLFRTTLLYVSFVGMSACHIVKLIVINEKGASAHMLCACVLGMSPTKKSFCVIQIVGTLVVAI
jgi:hypothetical protein